MQALFEELYNKYHNDLFNFLYYMVKNKEQAEDLIQEVYIKVLHSYDSFEGKSSEKTWLFSIARHVAIDWMRKQGRRKEYSGDWFDLLSTEGALTAPDPQPEDQLLINEEKRKLYEGLNKCNEKHRSVLVLRYLQSMSIAETAAVLGWTESKVKTTQHRALKKLNQYMSQSFGKEGNFDEQTPLDR
ncbi:RNA polymerase sigma factor SigX [Aureibacillus halotolerans]|uniref:RNA polymerase sigma factor n=1 Tax=Aureibacillus halotolerans TaxID=1508390 RepID=A0A4R6U7B9_9BACI|nr:RNA polymerase sigma factor SigX [Aureibacillus halotolerans]TDQ41572.1 RNA polymerase sigma (SigX) subunit [Aureibacillus halotolerans]